MKARSVIVFAQYALLVIGLSVWGYCATVWLHARLYQESAARSFDQKLALKKQAVVLRMNPKPGDLIGRLEILRIGLSVMVMEGVERTDLEHAVGHIPGTVLPGERGNMGLAGHRDSFFRPLAAIRVGDAISIETTERNYQYRVTSTDVVQPKDVSVLYPTGGETLTLVTCYPFHFVGAAPKRFIVHAVRLS